MGTGDEMRTYSPRFGEDSAGELYLMTKTDGMIRQVVGLR